MKRSHLVVKKEMHVGIMSHINLHEQDKLADLYYAPDMNSYKFFKFTAYILDPFIERSDMKRPLDLPALPAQGKADPLGVMDKPTAPPKAAEGSLKERLWTRYQLYDMAICTYEPRVILLLCGTR